MNTGDTVSDLQKNQNSVRSRQQSPTCSLRVALQLPGISSNPQHPVSWLGLDTSLRCRSVKKELNQTPLRTFLTSGNSRHDAAPGPQPEMSPSISMRSVSCSAHWVVQGAGRTRCCQCLQTPRTCDTRREVCSYYQGVTPWNAIAKRHGRTVSTSSGRWKPRAAWMETRSKSILESPAIWYEKARGLHGSAKQRETPLPKTLTVSGTPLKRMYDILSNFDIRD